MRSIRLYFALCAACLAFLQAAMAQAADTAPRPNVVVFLADDLGYGDVGEKENVAAKHADVVADLEARLKSQAARDNDARVKD